MRVKNPPPFFSRLILTAVCAFLLCAALASAQVTKVIHEFQDGNSNDGSQSYAGLTAGPHGELYGNSWAGGTNNGIVFELIPTVLGSWRYSILYTFAAMPDGANPRGTLARDHNGNLYGTTQVGGTFDCGTVFELSPPAIVGGAWTESVLYSFDCVNNNPNDGAAPLAGVVFDNLGNLYGTTENGGTQGEGVVFKLTPPSTSGGAWTETLLHSFHSGHDGAEPFYGLTFAGKGIFYGFTSYGGGSERGTFYQITAGGKETVLYTFHDGPDGGFPSGEPVLDASGNVYGTANIGGATGNGVVFEMTPPAIPGQPWTDNVLYSFSGTGGSSPSGVVFGPSGVLYGTSWGGGTTGDGVVFELTPPTSGGSWTESVLLDFNGNGNGQSVWAAPILLNGTLYGVTHTGGPTNAGTVVAVTP